MGYYLIHCLSIKTRTASTARADRIHFPSMKNNKASTAERPNDILDELHALVTKAEKIISRNADSGPEIASTLNERFRESRDQIGEFYSGAKKQIVAGAKSTHNAIQTNPYQSLAIATGVGVLIGILAGRRSCSGE